MGKSLQADGAILSRMDLSTAVRERPDLKVHKEICSTCLSQSYSPHCQQQATVRSRLMLQLPKEPRKKAISYGHLWGTYGGHRCPKLRKNETRAFMH